MEGCQKGEKSPWKGRMPKFERENIVWHKINKTFGSLKINKKYHYFCKLWKENYYTESVIKL